MIKVSFFFIFLGNMLLSCGNVQTIKGFLIYADESLTFVNDLNNMNDAFWVDDSEIREKVNIELFNESIVICCDSLNTIEKAIYVEMVAKVNYDGNYGHLGKYKNEIKVQKILDHSSEPVIAFLKDSKL